MKLTLLQIVQDMLLTIDAENVTDVGQTEEAGMCVNIANFEYETLMDHYIRWKHLKKFTVLSTTSNKNEMIGPTGVISIDPDNVYYDGNPVYYLSPEDFLTFTINRVATDSNITTINGIKVFNDRNPQYFTSDNNATLRFDAIPNAISGLASNKTNVIAYVGPTSRLTANGDFFNLPSVVYSSLEKLCMGKAIALLKGDTQTGVLFAKEAMKAVAAATRAHQLIDKPDDMRKWIVPRQTRRIIDTRQA